MKNAGVRVDEARNFLCTQVPVNERPGVRAFLDANRPTSLALSGEISSTNLDHPGNAPERMRRRALIMLAILNGASVPDLNAIRGLGAAQVTTLLATRVLALRYIADQANGGTGVIASVYNNKLVAAPAQFLATNPLLIYGSNTDGVVNQVFEYVWRYYQFKIIPPPSGQAHPHPCTVINIPAVPWDLVPNRTIGNTFAGIVGTELVGATVMTSTQFTGCSFCFKEVNGRMFAAHIMPDNGPAGGIAGGGNGLAQQLDGQVGGVAGGDFANAPPGGNFRVFGRGYSNIPGHAAGYNYTGPPSYMTIIGFLKPGGWHIYSQENTAAKTIVGPTRIL